MLYIQYIITFDPQGSISGYFIILLITDPAQRVFMPTDHRSSPKEQCKIYFFQGPFQQGFQFSNLALLMLLLYVDIQISFCSVKNSKRPILILPSSSNGLIKFQLDIFCFHLVQEKVSF